MTTIRIRVSGLLADGPHLLAVLHEKDGARYHLLPGGGVEPGETLPAALKREILEETGLTVDIGRLLGTTETLFPDGSRHILHILFLVKSWAGELSQDSTDERVIGVRWMHLDDLDTLPFLPEIRQFLRDQMNSGFDMSAWHIESPWVEV